MVFFSLASTAPSSFNDANGHAVLSYAGAARGTSQSISLTIQPAGATPHTQLH
jgi:hypothetical protein